MKKYELCEHTADLCISAKADTLSGLFEAAAEGLFNNIFNSAELSDNSEALSFSVTGGSKEEMLIKFLNELLYMFYTRKRLINGSFCYIKFAAHSLSAKADFVKVNKFSANFEVKAVTYGNIKIKYANNLYETTVIADV